MRVFVCMCNVVYCKHAAYSGGRSGGYLKAGKRRTT
jgi:hypothetical protein